MMITTKSLRVLPLTVLLGAAAAFAPGGAVAGEQRRTTPSLLALTEAQRAALGIEVLALGAPQPPIQPLLPGRVVLPNPGLHIVAARHAGVVTRLDAAPGDEVAAGQALGLVESAGVASEQRSFLDALSRHELARITEERERRLSEEGVVAARRGAEAEAALLAAAAALDQRRQALALLGFSEEAIATLAGSRRIAPGLSVTAPIAGEILEQYRRPGEHVAAGDPLYRIGSRNSLHVDVHVPLDVARWLAPGDVADVAGGAASGRVIAVVREVHDADQGILARVQIDDAVEVLHPGQFVAVRFTAAAGAGDAYQVPAAALVRQDGQAWAFVEQPEGFEPTAVEIAGGGEALVSIRGRLAPGQRIAVRGTAALKAMWLGAGGEDDD